MLHRILSVAVFVFALGIVVLADPPTLSIHQQATLDIFQGFPSGVIVSVTVDCGDPAPTEFELEVAVRQGDVAFTNFGEFFSATGGRQVVTTEVYGPFAVGDASATATLVCGPLIEGIELGTAIKITE